MRLNVRPGSGRAHGVPVSRGLRGRIRTLRTPGRLLAELDGRRLRPTTDSVLYTNGTTGEVSFDSRRISWRTQLLANQEGTREHCGAGGLLSHATVPRPPVTRVAPKLISKQNEAVPYNRLTPATQYSRAML